MALRALDTLPIAPGDRVLVRAQTDVPLENADAAQLLRLETLRPTVDALVARGARVALVGHRGRPSGRAQPDLSLAPLADDLARILARPVVFVGACVGEAVRTAIAGAAPDAVLLLENVRFHAEETSADPAVRRAFAEALAAPFAAVVSDAFSVAHRAHASMVELPVVRPSAAGVQMAREVEVLTAVRDAPRRPAVAIIGGAKIATKLPLIRALERHYDAVLVGGKVANEALDEGLAFAPRVLLPTDFVGDREDIGPRTRAAFRAAIADAATIVWNGPLGRFEDPAFAVATEEIARAIAAADGFTVVGGGESVEVVEKLGLRDKMDFVSTGGGAMLDFLAGATLPGVKALQA